MSKYDELMNMARQQSSQSAPVQQQTAPQSQQTSAGASTYERLLGLAKQVGAEQQASNPAPVPAVGQQPVQQDNSYLWGGFRNQSSVNRYNAIANYLNSDAVDVNTRNNLMAWAQEEAAAANPSNKDQVSKWQNAIDVLNQRALYDGETIHQQRQQRQQELDEQIKAYGTQLDSLREKSNYYGLSEDELNQMNEIAKQRKALRAEYKEASARIEWDGRADLVKEYVKTRPDPSTAEFDPEYYTKLQKSQELLDQIQRGDIIAGNGVMDVDAYDRIMSVFSGAGGRIGAGLTNLVGTVGQALEEADRAGEGGSVGWHSDAGRTAEEQEAVHQQAEERWGKVYDVADKMSAEAAEDVARAKNGLGKFGQAAVDVGGTMLEMGFDAGVAMATGGSSLASMFARVAGGSMQEARQGGADLDQQLKYGLTKAGIEVLTEQLADGLAGIYGAGAADDIAETVIRRLSKGSPAAQTFLRFLYSASAEGAEEVMSDLLDPFAQTILNDETVKTLLFDEEGNFGKGSYSIDPADTLYSFILGAVTGAFGGVTSAATGQGRAANAENNQWTDVYNQLGEKPSLRQELSDRRLMDRAEESPEAYNPANRTSVEQQTNDAMQTLTKGQSDADRVQAIQQGRYAAEEEAYAKYQAAVDKAMSFLGLSENKGENGQPSNPQQQFVYRLMQEVDAEEAADRILEEAKYEQAFEELTGLDLDEVDDKKGAIVNAIKNATGEEVALDHESVPPSSQEATEAGSRELNRDSENGGDIDELYKQSDSSAPEMSVEEMRRREIERSRKEYESRRSKPANRPATEEEKRQAEKAGSHNRAGEVSQSKFDYSPSKKPAAQKLKPDLDYSKFAGQKNGDSNYRSAQEAVDRQNKRIAEANTRAQTKYYHDNPLERGKTGNRDIDAYLEKARADIKDDCWEAISRILSGDGEWEQVPGYVRAGLLNWFDPNNEYYHHGDTVERAAKTIGKEATEQEINDIAKDSIRPDVRGKIDNIHTDPTGKAGTRQYQLTKQEAEERKQFLEEQRLRKEGYIVHRRLGKPADTTLKILKRAQKDINVLAQLVKGEGDYSKISASRRFDMLRAAFPQAEWRFDGATDRIYLADSAQLAAEAAERAKTFSDDNWSTDFFVTDNQHLANGGISDKMEEIRSQGGVPYERRGQVERKARVLDSGRRNQKSVENVKGTRRRAAASGIAEALRVKRSATEGKGQAGTGTDRAVWGGYTPALTSEAQISAWERFLKKYEFERWFPIGHLTDSMTRLLSYADRLGVPVTFVDASRARGKVKGTGGVMHTPSRSVFVMYGEEKNAKASRGPTLAHEFGHFARIIKGKRTGYNSTLLTKVVTKPGLLTENSFDAISRLTDDLRNRYNEVYARGFGKTYDNLDAADEETVDHAVEEEVFNELLGCDYDDLKRFGFAKEEVVDLADACIDAAVDDGLFTPEQAAVLREMREADLSDDFYPEIQQEQKDLRYDYEHGMDYQVDANGEPVFGKNSEDAMFYKLLDSAEGENQTPTNAKEYAAQQKAKSADADTDAAAEAWQDAERVYGSETHQKLSDASFALGKVMYTTNEAGDLTIKESARYMKPLDDIVKGLANGTMSVSEFCDAYRALGEEENHGKAGYFFDQKIAKQVSQLKAMMKTEVTEDGQLTKTARVKLQNVIKQIQHRAERAVYMREFNSEAVGEMSSNVKGKDGKMPKLFQMMAQFQTRPDVFFKIAGAFSKEKSAKLYGIAQQTVDSTKRKYNTHHTAEAFFQPATKNTKAYRDFAEGKTKIKRTIPGLGRSMSMNEALGLLRTLETDGAIEHMIKCAERPSGDAGFGTEFSNSENELFSGKNRNGFGDRPGYGKRTTLLSERTQGLLAAAKSGKEIAQARAAAHLELEGLAKTLRAEIEADPTARLVDQGITRAMRYLGKEIDRTHISLYGVRAAVQGKTYWPMTIAKSGQSAELDSDFDFSNKNASFLQEREGPSGALRIMTATDVMSRYIDKATDFVSFAELSDQLDLMSRDYTGDTSFKAQVINSFGDKAGDWLQKYRDCLDGKSEKGNETLAKLRSNLAQASLLLNGGVALKQTPSYWDAAGAAGLDWDIVASSWRPFRMAKTWEKNSLLSAVSERSSILEARKMGYNDVEMGEMTARARGLTSKIVSRIPTPLKNWINRSDFRTVSNVLLACSKQVERDYPHVQKGSILYYDMITQKFEQAVLESQPVYIKQFRAEYQRSDNEVVRTLSMFRSQQTQNFNQLVTAVGEWHAAKNGGSESAVKAARARMRKVISGQVVGSVFFGMLSGLARALLRKDKDFEDKDGNVTVGSVTTRLLLNGAGSMASTVWFGDTLANVLVDSITNATTGGNGTNEFYSFADGTLSTVNDVLTNVVSFASKPSIKTGKNLAFSISQASGLPLRNVYNMLNAVAVTGLDISGKNYGKYTDITEYYHKHNNMTDSQIAKETSRAAIRCAVKGKADRLDAILSTLDFSNDDVKNAVQKEIKQAHLDGKITTDMYRHIMRDYIKADPDKVEDKVQQAKQDKAYKDLADTDKDKFDAIADEIAQIKKDMDGQKSEKDRAAMERVLNALLPPKDTDTLVNRHMSGTYKQSYNVLRDNGKTPEQAAKMINAIDDMDNPNGSLTQAEMWAYYEKHPESENVIAALWNAKGWKTSWDQKKAKSGK